MPFTFLFTGSFFDMEKFLHEVHSFVRFDGKRIDVSGRLLSVDAFSLAAGASGFPQRAGQHLARRPTCCSPDDASTTTTPSTATPSTTGATPAAGTAPSTTPAASEVTR